MKKLSNYFWLFAVAALLLNSCSKSSNGGGTPTPEPEPPVTPTGLVFPKKEMRAVWMTTAWGIDWPMTDYSQAGQKQKYIQYLDKFKQMNINTIYFQVRAMGDAYYASAYEPWATSITGTRGKDPGYDVMKFLIEEAHARGIEFHAWMNPYRIATRAGTSAAYPALHSSINGSWVIDHEKIQIYNPARPEVRQRIADIVKELISKYDVDGVHLDDYFYPDPASAGVMISDQADFQTYGAGFANIASWRRSNVDKAIEGIYKTIVATKPAVVFSISPAASKDYNYNTLFADLAKWCQEGWVDVLIPQLYQEIGNKSNDFQANLSIWSQFSYKAALVIGHGFYKFGDPLQGAAFQSTVELEKQFEMAKKNAKVVGSTMYSAKYILDNKIGITDKLTSLYSKPAVMPFVGRATAPAPVTPTNVRLEAGQLKWASTGNAKTVVYYFSDLKKEGEVLAITNEQALAIDKAGHYCVTSLSIDNQESKASVTVQK